ncbi:acyl-CoA dehydrogenase [Arthrobacter livingstonensis]|uniref:Acyl-CoA dehydrogenase n=1 Tax=Arthrobacter livingstonensis TaxID=670078 RepID=A0A2V5LTS6_9MICC|nr:acyl-CoA dehydrogenase family protein [Arthrobacter livingstonensis]PYI65236.1 acyl-CoA dehydrogenase [Arthrobacter livingstonensis]
MSLASHTSPATHVAPSDAATTLGVQLDATAAAPSPDSMAPLNEIYAAALSCHGETASILALARELGRTMPLPQQGHTLDLWQSLATLGAADLTAARIIEPHLDALAILAQADQTELHTDNATWGVFAAQGPGQQLLATPAGSGWRLDGDKPWCSLANELSNALVTARTDNGIQLFAIDLRVPGITSAGRPWTALGLPTVPSQGLSMSNVPAVPVGAPEWYVQRPGFSWGGAGVAAIWHGAATALARRLYQHCRSRKPDQIALLHLGSADQALWASRSSFQAAAPEADGARRTDAGFGTHSAIVAGRVRATVVSAAETVLSVTAHGMGPEPLAFEPEHTQRVADLQLYLRQDHAERSIAAHGAAILAAVTASDAGTAPW